MTAVLPVIETPSTIPDRTTRTTVAHQTMISLERVICSSFATSNELRGSGHEPFRSGLEGCLVGGARLFLRLACLVGFFLLARAFPLRRLLFIEPDRLRLSSSSERFEAGRRDD